MYKKSLYVQAVRWGYYIMIYIIIYIILTLRTSGVTSFFQYGGGEDSTIIIYLNINNLTK